MSHRTFDCNIVFEVIILIIGTLSVSVAQAEYFGSPSGRTADFSLQPQLTLEAAFSKGDFENTDYQQQGIRLNYQYTPNIIMFGNIGKSELASTSDTSFGFGAFYSLEQSIFEHDSALKVSFHQVDFGSSIGASGSGGLVQQCTTSTSSGGGLDLLSPLECTAVPAGTSSASGGGGDVRNIAIELIVSGEMPSSSLVGGLVGGLAGGMSWYANGGIQIFSGGIVSNTILGFGAGIVFSFSESEIYSGIEYADEAFLGIGFRYFIK